MDDQPSEFSLCVAFRLAAYNLYEQGSVIWKHSTLAPQGIICSKASDPDDPRTYVFPHPQTGKIITGEAICKLYNGKPDWSSLHSYFEKLSDEWTCELGNIEIHI